MSENNADWPTIPRWWAYPLRLLLGVALATGVSRLVLGNWSDGPACGVGIGVSWMISLANRHRVARRDAPYRAAYAALECNQLPDGTAELVATAGILRQRRLVAGWLAVLLAVGGVVAVTVVLLGYRHTGEPTDLVAAGVLGAGAAVLVGLCGWQRRRTGGLLRRCEPAGVSL